MPRSRPTPFRSIDQEDFIAFHRDFEAEQFGVCLSCGGACEYGKILTLLPGETEFIAQRLGVTVQAFEERHLDFLVTPKGVASVFRFKSACSFLDPTDFHCQLRDHKPVLCACYPISFRPGAAQEIELFLDPWCPLARTAAGQRQFGAAAQEVYRRIPIPRAWYDMVMQYDELWISYERYEQDHPATGSPRWIQLEDLGPYLHHAPPTPTIDDR